MKKYCYFLLCVVTTFLCSCSSSDDDSNNAGSMTPTEITAIIKGSWGVHGNVSYDFYNKQFNPQNQKAEGNYQGILRLLDNGKYKFTASKMPQDVSDFISRLFGIKYSSYFPYIIKDSGDWEVLKNDGDAYLVLGKNIYFKITNLSKDGFRSLLNKEETFLNMNEEVDGIYKYYATMDSYGHE